MIADCPPPPSPNVFTHWVTLRKLLPFQGPSEGALCGSLKGPLVNHRETRHQPQPKVEPECWPCPVEGVLLQETLEGRQGWQTAAGVK